MFRLIRRHDKLLRQLPTATRERVAAEHNEASRAQIERLAVRERPLRSPVKRIRLGLGLLETFDSHVEQVRLNVEETKPSPLSFSCRRRRAASEPLTPERARVKPVPSPSRRRHRDRASARRGALDRLEYRATPRRQPDTELHTRRTRGLRRSVPHRRRGQRRAARGDHPRRIPAPRCPACARLEHLDLAIVDEVARGLDKVLRGPIPARYQTARVTAGCQTESTGLEPPAGGPGINVTVDAAPRATRSFPERRRRGQPFGGFGSLP